MSIFPIEIYNIIIRYLPPLECYTYRVISKDWNTIIEIGMCQEVLRLMKILSSVPNYELCMEVHNITFADGTIMSGYHAYRYNNKHIKRVNKNKVSLNP